MPNSVPLGQLTVTKGCTAGRRFERLANKAWLTRKISLLLPTGTLSEEDKAQLVSRIQLQRHHFMLEDVSLDGLGHPSFVTAMERWRIAGISQGERGLNCGDVLALLPGRLVAALQGASYRRLGLEEPMAGSSQLEQKYLPQGQRHVFADLPVSKTRAKRAAKTGEVATSRWQALVAPLEEKISMLAYCDKEPDPPYDFGPLQSASATIRQQEVPVRFRYLSLEAGGIRTAVSSRPPLEQLLEPERFKRPEAQRPKADLPEAYGAACEDLLDWLGALQLDLDHPIGGELWQVDEPTVKPPSEEVLQWTMGESLMGPSQILHVLKICQDALQSHAAWFILSIWGAEDSPISHHGGAHSFDINGAHHAHLIRFRGEEAQTLLIEEANALHSDA